MKFHLQHLIIWPKLNSFPPRVLSFKSGQLNVITGVSRTGKSAIIPIIDYCLASSDCYIPIDTIRNKASWYGVVFETEGESILICRKVPDGNKVSNDFYLERGTAITIPPSIKNANENVVGVKVLLDSISAVPYFRLDPNENRGYKARLGFRDLMAMVFQNQDIVANQNILFYKTHSHEHRERLRNWFPYILGAETIDVLIARQELNMKEKQLAQMKRELEKAKAVSEAWKANMLGHLRVAKEYGLIQEVDHNIAEPSELVETAKDILENIPEYSSSTSSDIDKANRELLQFEKEEETLSESIGVTKKRLGDLRRLKDSLSSYDVSIRKRRDRLHISQWFEDLTLDSSECPTCGSSDHPNKATEVHKISSIFRKFEEQAKGLAKIPTAFEREEAMLSKELDEQLARKKLLEERFDLLRRTDKKLQADFQRTRNMYLFLGHMRASMELIEKIAIGGENEILILQLEREVFELRGIVDQSALRKRIGFATDKVSAKILDHLKTLDVDSKYRTIAPRLSIDDLNLKVKSDDGHWHFLAEVGSASNWVAFDVSLMCALQEYFLSLGHSSVPSFVIFDQPSQVYFPKLRQKHSLSNGDISYEDEDVKAVRSIFKTIADSIISENGNWQAIILDHADSDIYGMLDGVHEVEEWRHGLKLVPEEW